MIKIENESVVGLAQAIRGMRNPMNSWNKSDSGFWCPHGEYEQGVERCTSCVKEDCGYIPLYAIGENDMQLMKKLFDAGTEHRKYLRMIQCYADVTAPLYWWKEADTYRYGVEKNSCSTMHRIHAEKFTLEDFSYEHLLVGTSEGVNSPCFDNLADAENYKLDALDGLEIIIDLLNGYREKYIETKEKKYWDQMIQLLPSSYNQKRTMMFSYEALANIYRQRRNHKLDEWKEFCTWIKRLPYSGLITGEENKEKGYKNDK